MRKTMVSFLSLAALSCAALPARAAIEITQFPSPAPNIFGSPSWAGYLANAMNSLENNLGNVGDISTSPTAYVQLTGGYLPGMIEVTSFPSWLGSANPTGAFANELGNRLHFGLVVHGTLGSTFDLQDVTFNFTSSDSSLNFAGDLSGTNFSSGSRVGIKQGGGVCDATHPCTDTTLLTDLFYVGVGNAFAPVAATPADRQAALDDTTDYIVSNQLSVSNRSCVQGTCDTVTLDVIPEPSGTAALIAGCVGLLRLRHKARRRSA